MSETLTELIARLESAPRDVNRAHEVRMDGDTFRAILWHLRQAAEYVAIERLELGKQGSE